MTKRQATVRGALLAGLIIAGSAGAAAQESAVAPEKAAAATEKAAAIEWTGGLGATSAWRNHDIPFWLRVVNPLDAPIMSLRIRAVGGDVSIVTVCTPGLEPPCDTGDNAMTVSAHAEAVYEGVLRVDGTGDRELALLLTAPGHQWSVPLGKLVSNGWFERLKLLGELAALPIIGGLLLFLYNRWTHWRERQEKELAAKRETLERELAAQKAEAARKAAQHAETVRTMLPIVQKYAVRYYGAMADSARNFYDQMLKTPPDIDEALFWLVRLHLKNRIFGQQVGSFYLATLAAEKITERASRLWIASIFPTSANRDGMRQLLNALQATSPAASPTEVEDRVLSPAHFAAHIRGWQLQSSERIAYDSVKVRLDTWSRNGQGDLGYAWLYGEVLQRETDLMFEQWYGNAPEPIAVPDELKKLAKDVCDQLESNAPAARLYLGLNR